MDSLNKTLEQELADALPDKAAFTSYHISTPPTSCPPIYSSPPTIKPAKTYRESHLLNVSIQKPGEEAVELFVVAIECLIYTTEHLTTLFVSKADSTGYLTLLNLDRAHPSPLRTIATTFVSHLVRNRVRPNTTLVVDLFARASDQYLYPGSVENERKHVLDDRQLIKWWCRVLDPVFRPYAAQTATGLFEEKIIPTDTTAQAYLVVPGEETILSFLPETVRYDPEARKRWTSGHPLQNLAVNPNVPPRCLIPHFPDDPKGRFLVELDDELPDAAQVTESPSKRGNGEWRSVKNLEQFWEMMAFRSECSSGRLVGFIWLVFTPPKTESAESQNSLSSLSSLSEDQDTPKNAEEARVRSKSPARRRKAGLSRKLSGPIVPRLPRIKSARSDISIMLPETSSHYYWPRGSRGELVMDDKKYEKATEILLGLDFANEEIAAQSTKTWIIEVGLLGNSKGSWGKDVRGLKAPTPPKINAANAGATLLGTKRKPVGDGPANTLNGNLVRKKPKANAEEVKEGTANQTEPVANTLGAGLVRKKPKKVAPTLVTGS